MPEYAGHHHQALSALAMQSLAQGVVVHDASGAIIWCNPAASIILGIPDDQLFGRHPIDPTWRAVHADGTPWPGDSHPAMRTLASRQPVAESPMGVHRPDGTLVWLSVSSQPITLPDGSPGASASFVDMSALYADFNESREVERAALDALRDQVFVGASVRDDDGRIVDFTLRRINHQGAVLMGAKPEMLIGSRLLDGFPEFAFNGRFDQFRHVVETGEPLHYEFSSAPDAPVQRTFECHLAKAADGLVMMLHDVTEHHRLQQKLDRGQRQYRLLADNAGDVVILKRDGIIQWVGPSVKDLLGWTPDELVGVETASIVHPDDRYLLAQPNGDQAETRERVRVRMRRSDGSWRWVEKNSRPLPDDDGSVGWHSIVTTVWDVQAKVEALQALARAEAKRRQLERAVEQAAHMESLGVLAGGIAHDFNNLLMAILGNTDLVLNDLGPDSPHAPLLADAVTAAERGAVLTKQLLAYAQRSPAMSVSLDLSELATATSPVLRSSLPSNATFSLQTDSRLPRIKADRSLVTQVITNLVTNAAEALNGEGGMVRIRTFVDVRSVSQPDDPTIDATEPCVCMEVTDTGSGMDPDTVRQMFDPFFSTKFAGRGLGLAAVHGIVNAAGGSIDVTSSLGEGTTVVVRLPLEEASAPTNTAPVRYSVVP